MHHVTNATFPDILPCAVRSAVGIAEKYRFIGLIDKAPRVQLENVVSAATRGAFSEVRYTTLGGDLRTLTSLLALWQNRCQAIGSGLAVVRVCPMQRIGFIAFPNFQVLSLCTVSVFECANILAPEPLYELHMLSEAGGTIRTSSGLALETKKFDETEFDTLIVLGTLVNKPTFSPGLLSYVKNAPSRARRVASICTGALALAEAGLLENRRVTTHWAYARYFRERFPNLNLEEDRIFIIDGSIWTSAGCTACIDLALAMVEKDAGKELARAVSRELVMYHRRAGGQTQHSALLELEPKSDRIQSALNYARCNLHTSLTVDQLAEAAHLSPRQFSRAFHLETGQSPAKAIENLRIEAARLMVEQGRHSIDVIARETGFGSRDRMRRAFIRRFGQAPQEIRRDVRANLRAASAGADEIARQSL